MARSRGVCGIRSHVVGGWCRTGRVPGRIDAPLIFFSSPSQRLTNKERGGHTLLHFSPHQTHTRPRESGGAGARNIQAFSEQEWSGRLTAVPRLGHQSLVGA